MNTVSLPEEPEDKRVEEVSPLRKDWDSGKENILLRVRLESRKAFREMEAAMKLMANAQGEKNPHLAGEMNYSMDVMKEHETDFFHRLEEIDDFRITIVEELMELLPPNNVLIRYDLERLTQRYERLCRSSSSEIISLFDQGEKAIDRGDYDIGLNVLEQVLRKDPRNFQTLIVLAYSCIMHRHDFKGAIKFLERAISNLPLQATEHYKYFIISLLAKAYEINGNYVNAMMTLKRLHYYNLDNLSSNYVMARNYTMCGRGNDAMILLNSILEANPLYFSSAMVDEAFRSIQQQLFNLFAEKNEKLNKRISYMFGGLLDIRHALKETQPRKLDSELHTLLERLSDAETLLPYHCLSANQKLSTEILPHLVPSFPNKVQSLIGLMLDRKLNEIQMIITSREEELIAQKHRLIRKGLTAWLILLLIAFIILLISGISLSMAFLSEGILALLGFSVFVLMKMKPIQPKELNEEYQNTVDLLRAQLSKVDALKVKLSEYVG